MCVEYLEKEPHSKDLNVEDSFFDTNTSIFSEISSLKAEGDTGDKKCVFLVGLKMPLDSQDGCQEQFIRYLKRGIIFSKSILFHFYWCWH